MRKRLTKKQANQLVNIGRFGSCGPVAMKISKETLNRFLKEREIALIEKNLPNASKGIKGKISFSSRMGLKNPVLDYFFKEHNTVVMKTLNRLKKEGALKPDVKKAQARRDIEKCVVNIGKVISEKKGKYTVQLPNGQRIEVFSDVKKPSKFVLTHAGYIVSNASKREYNKYSEYY